MATKNEQRNRKSGGAPVRDALLERVNRAMVGQYEIQGTGPAESLAAAYVARDVRTDERVSLRVFRPELFTLDGAAVRFPQQLAGALSLRHPNIVAARSVEHRDGLVFLVTDAVSGSSLELVLGFEPLLAAQLARSVLLQLAYALDHAHGQGVVHGGVRPSAVMITAAGDVRLADLGLIPALAASGAAVDVLPSLSSRYQSPDTIRTGFTSESSDQYSLGVVAYEMLMGKPPFAGTAAEVRQAHLTRKPDPVTHPDADIPADLAEAVARMLGKTPRDRFQGMADAVDALASGLSEFDDRSRGPLSWLAQQTSEQSLADGGTTPSERRRPIVQTPLPFVETLPPLAPRGARTVQLPVTASMAATVAAPEAPSQMASIDDFAPGAAALTATAASQQLPAAAPFGRAIQHSRSQNRTLVATAVVVVLVGGAAWWRSTIAASKSAVADALSQTREAINFSDREPTPARSLAPAVEEPAAAVVREPPPKPVLARTLPVKTPVAKAPAVKSTVGSTKAPVTSKSNAAPTVAASAAVTLPPVAAPQLSLPVVSSAPVSVPVAPAPSSALASALALAATTPPAAPAPRLSEADAARAARTVVDRVRNSDVDGLGAAMSGSRADRDFMAWLAKRPLDLRVGESRAAGVVMQPDGSARVSYVLPISWTHVSGAKPVRTASMIVVVSENGKVASWSLGAPFVP